MTDANAMGAMGAMGEEQALEQAQAGFDAMRDAMPAAKVSSLEAREAREAAKREREAREAVEREQREREQAKREAREREQAKLEAAKREAERIRANANAYTQGRELAVCELVDGSRSIPALWLFYTGGHHVLCSGAPDNFYMGAAGTASPEGSYPEGSLYRPVTPEQAREWLAKQGYSGEIIAALLCPR